LGLSNERLQAGKQAHAKYIRRQEAKKIQSAKAKLKHDQEATEPFLCRN